MSKIARRLIFTSKAPKPAGPYSQGVLVGDTLYLAGQLGINPEIGKLVEGGVTAEAEQMIKNFGAVVEEAGGSLKNVVKTTILLQDIKDWPTVNVVYEKFFGERPPARAAYQVAALPKGALVEMEGIAVIGDIVEK